MTTNTATETTDAGQEMPKSAMAALLLRLDSMEARQDRIINAVDALTGDVAALMDGLINTAEDLAGRLDKVETLVHDESAVIDRKIDLVLKDTRAIYSATVNSLARFNDFLANAVGNLPKDDKKDAAPTSADKLFG